jgi:hypothetical protein
MNKNIHIKNISIIAKTVRYFNEIQYFIHIYNGLCIKVMDNTRYC